MQARGVSQLNIVATSTTPEVLFLFSEGCLEITGISVPPDAAVFYSAIFDALDQYVKKPAAVTTLKIHLEYFNIGSSKMLLFIFYRLAELRDAGHKVKVEWYYTDEDLKEAGSDYKFMTGLEFCILNAVTQQLSQ